MSCYLMSSKMLKLLKFMVESQSTFLSHLIGYDMGIISGAKPQMQRSLGLTCSNLEWVVSLLPVGGFIAALTGGM